MIELAIKSILLENITIIVYYNLNLISKMFKSSTFNFFLRFFLNSWNQLIKTINRNFFWRIRFSGVAELTVDNLPFKMYADWDDGIVDALYFDRTEYSELNEVKVFKELSQYSKIIFDIGANTGIYSIVSKLSNPSLEIYAFEPYEINRNRLEKNLLLNQLSKEVNVIDYALGISDSKIQFAVPVNDQVCDTLSADLEFTNKFYKESIEYKNILVQQTSVDEFVAKNKIENIDLIKIDVENYELEVFMGAINTITNFSPIILVEIFVDEKRMQYYNEILKPLGYQCYIFLENGLIRVNSLHNYSVSRNFLFVKTFDAIEYIPYGSVNSIFTKRNEITFPR